MKNKLPWLYAAAGLALAAGLGLTLPAARTAGPRLQRLQHRAETLAELQQLARAQADFAAALQAFAALTNPAPATLASLAAGAAPGAAPDIRVVASRPLAEGWTLTQAEVVFNEISLERLGSFLAAASSGPEHAGRPPWRLCECDLAASSRSDGGVRAVLLLEAVGRPAP